MAFELNLGSVRATAKNTLATPWLMANVANVAKEPAQNQPEPPETLATLAGLATLAISQQRLKTFQAPANAPLLTGADTAPTPPKAPPPSSKAGAGMHAAGYADQAPKAPPAPAKPMGRWHMNQRWRAADRLYQNHHWQCPECMASARAAPGTAERCTEGQRLHDDYAAQAAAA